jgi:hypothetical protein
LKDSGFLLLRHRTNRPGPQSEKVQKTGAPLSRPRRGHVAASTVCRKSDIAVAAAVAGLDEVSQGIRKIPDRTRDQYRLMAMPRFFRA